MEVVPCIPTAKVINIFLLPPYLYSRNGIGEEVDSSNVSCTSLRPTVATEIRVPDPDFTYSEGQCTGLPKRLPVLR